MRRMKRALSLFLAVVMCGSLMGPSASIVATQEDTQPRTAAATGSLEVTLRFDYPQMVDQAETRNITLTLTATGGVPIGVYNLSKNEVVQPFPGEAQLTVKNRDGVTRTTEYEVGYYTLLLSGLPANDYILSLTGDGYRSFSGPVSLADYSQHVILGTGDATFTLGDLNADGQVDVSDRDLLSAALGDTDADSLAKFDLNGDGAVDIVDLAYVNHNIGAQGNMESYPTSPINPASLLSNDTAELDASVSLSGTDGQPLTAADLLQGGHQVIIAPAPDQDDLVIPLSLKEPTEMEQVEIASPIGDGALRSGTVQVVYLEEDGTEATMPFPFDTSVPNGISLLSATQNSVVTINLGKRVPVKKITITVTAVEGQDGQVKFAAVEEIKFLQNVVPESPVAPYSQVRDVVAQAGDSSVTLKWPELPNVSGYKVEYSPVDPTQDKNNVGKELHTEFPYAEISNLKNLVAYTFTVTPESDGWTGTPSTPVEATPQPSSVPSKPDFVKLTELDRALGISWGKAENGITYSVYYRAGSSGDFIQAVSGIEALQYTIAGLINDTQYEVYVTSSNTVGESPASNIVVGTPQVAKLEEPEGIPTEGRMDPSNVTSIKLTDTGNYDSEEYPNKDFDIKHVLDGDYTTHWTSQSYGHGNWSRNKEIQFTFETPMTMSYAVWVPRLDGTYRNNLRLYTVKVTDSNGVETTLVNDRGVQGSPQTTGFAILPFPATSDIVKISITIEQTNYTAVSLSEMIFFHYDESKDLAKQISDLFTDGSMTALKDTSQATADQIAALKVLAADPQAANYCFSIQSLQDELALAESLLPGHTPALGAVSGVQSRSGSAAGNQGQGGSLLQPLGAVAGAKSEISVYASIPDGETVTLYATQYNAEASVWQKTVTQLSDGRNVIVLPQIGSQNTPRGGSLYVTYSGDKADQIRIQVRRATDIPMLELSDLDLETQADTVKERMSAYLDELDAYLSSQKFSDAQTNFRNSTELSMRHVLLSIPADAVSRALASADRVTQLYDNALAWEQLMEICCYTQGMEDNSGMQVRQNIRYMQMFAGAFMYAAGSHVGIGYGSSGAMVCGRPVERMSDNATKNQLFGWGIAHEIGHNMDKLGKAEITNNIYSLMVQTYDGKANTLTSRLEPLYTSEDGIFNKVAHAYPGASSSVFVQLGMYWQLHLAYDDGENPMNFYHQFFQLWKSGAASSSGYSYDERVAVVASMVAQRDLSDFFTHWGMELGETARAAMAEAGVTTETRAIWYLSDESRRYRLNSGLEAQGSISHVTASIDRDDPRQVNLQFSYNKGNDGAIQGYEITRNNQVIAFTTEESFVDVVGSANNQAVQYTVQAYDLLGNAVGSPERSNEVRISYTRTVPQSDYTYQINEDQSVIFTFHSDTKVAVSGIKLDSTDGLGSGSYYIYALTGDTQQPVRVKDSSFDRNLADTDSGAFIAYLNHPTAVEQPAPSNTSDEDTRIFTAYDVQQITIGGLPADYDLSNVHFITYAGDNVGFTPGAMMGLMANDYTYDTGDGGTETIPAGTLIITGEYRGDPVYSNILISGKFAQTTVNDVVYEHAERPIGGELLIFAAVPEDGVGGDISDGFFLFVPEQSLQQGVHTDEENENCEYNYVLPAQIKAQLFRTDDPTSTDSQRLTSDTIWMEVPDAATLPKIDLTGRAAEVNA